MGKFIATLELLSEDEKKVLDSLLNGFAEKISKDTKIPKDEAKASIVSLLDKGFAQIVMDDAGNFSLLPTTKAGKAMLKGLMS